MQRKDLKLRIVFLFTILFLFINLGFTAAQPWQQNDLIFNPSGIPSLQFSQPRFADLDADGDFDMILGSLDNQPIYFENTGSVNIPAFKENADVFSIISSTDAEMGVCVDLDNDGDLDFITGGFTGLHLFENVGDDQNPFFEQGANIFTDLTVGENPIPTFADVMPTGTWIYWWD